MRKADGTLDERVEEANVAKRADTAGRLYAPVKLSCLGVVSGVVEIDGSKDVLLPCRERQDLTASSPKPSRNT